MKQAKHATTREYSNFHSYENEYCGLSWFREETTRNQMSSWRMGGV